MEMPDRTSPQSTDRKVFLIMQRATFRLVSAVGSGSPPRRGLFVAALAIVLGACGGGNGSVDSASGPGVASVGSSSANLCEGLVTDKLAHAMTDVAKPAVGGSFVDPQFGTTIRRISDAAAKGFEFIKPMYSTIQAWNADETRLILLRPGGWHELYDGKTYQYLRTLDDISPADDEQVYWDTTDPQVLYYANIVERRLYRYNVETRAKTMLRDFSTPPTSCGSGVDLTGGTDPMYMSWQGRKIGLTCGGKIFSYDIDAGVVGTVLTKTTGEGGAQNAPQAAPSGTRYFLNDSDRIGTVRDANMNELLTLDVINSGEHGSLGRLASGHDIFYSVQFDSGPVAARAGKDNSGTLVAHDMWDGSWRVIIGQSQGYPYPPSGTHISAVAHKNPGWVAVSVIGDLSGGKLGQGVLESEIILADTNPGGAVCRVAHHRSCGGNCGTIGYFAEPHVVISPSGTRMIFGSDWGGGKTADTYVVELPAYRP
ncbi:MAG: hypothetical protein BroJett024_39100 [Alphaproteobacteria bacterium]|jgi:hypothetical protein|nr:MAG: hypothetical protein BroJett024_39100 [Alphaproteobacteria bacterium]